MIGRRSLDGPSDSPASLERSAEPGEGSAAPAGPSSAAASLVSVGPTDSPGSDGEDIAVVASAARHRRLRRVLLPAGVFVILAGCGIGAWLATRGSSPTADMATANRLFSEGLQAQTPWPAGLAANDYLRSVKINPQNKVAWYDLGLIQQYAGKTARPRSTTKGPARSIRITCRLCTISVRSWRRGIRPAQ